MTATENYVSSVIHSMLSQEYQQMNKCSFQLTTSLEWKVLVTASRCCQTNMSCSTDSIGVAGKGQKLGFPTGRWGFEGRAEGGRENVEQAKNRQAVLGTVAAMMKSKGRRHFQHLNQGSAWDYSRQPHWLLLLCSPAHSTAAESTASQEKLQHYIQCWG